MTLARKLLTLDNGDCPVQVDLRFSRVAAKPVASPWRLRFAPQVRADDLRIGILYLDSRYSEPVFVAAVTSDGTVSPAESFYYGVLDARGFRPCRSDESYDDYIGNLAEEGQED